MSTVGEQIRDELLSKEKTEQIDYKMVTFSLAGKDYGIDIMTVKEISKAAKFTYVPNSVPYVKGVYNLRGEIISVIDLRIMFNLPAPANTEKVMENMIILRLEDYLIGVIVDSIDKVVGISSGNIQPPHPLFGDINIKYIKGVVDHDNNLYIILDAERILGSSSFEEEETSYIIEEAAPEPTPSAAADSSEVSLNFISETLITFKSFYVTDLNKEWVTQRFKEWKKQKKGDIEAVQLDNTEEAEDFLRPFYSQYNRQFWGEEYLNKLEPLFTDLSGNMITAWNPGCGKGYETFSFCTLLRNMYPDAQIKIWGNDNDLLSISNAPNMVFQKSELPAFYDPFLTEGKNGVQFNANIKDVILFEYHDILHQNPFPPVDIILARDLVSFMKPANQQHLIKEFWEKLKPEGILILGPNENNLDEELFSLVDNFMGIFKKRS